MLNLKSNVLVDTSVWIESYRKPKSKLTEILKELLQERRVVTAGIIIAEILQGTKTQKDFEDLKMHLVTLPVLPEGIEEWEAVGLKSHTARKEGCIVPLSDCLVAVLAEKNNCEIFTLDKHFNKLKGVVFFSHFA